MVKGSSGADESKCNVKWKYDQSTQVLTIGGSGPMKNYTYERRFWYSTAYTDSHYFDYGHVECVQELGHSICPWSRLSIKKVIIGPDVKTIGSGAFAGLNELESVNIPEGIDFIGKGAFEFCSSLESVDISGNVKTIEDYAFFKCESLKKVIIPEGVEKIGESAFGYCGINFVHLPSSLKELNRYAFMGCPLEEIEAECVHSKVTPDSLCSGYDPSVKIHATIKYSLSTDEWQDS